MFRTRFMLSFGTVILIAAAAHAQTPACGSVITTTGATITFDSDMNCGAGFTGTALTVQANDVTVDGAGFSIIAPDAAAMVFAFGANSTVVSNLDVSGNQNTGISFNGTSNSTVTNVNASGTSNVGIGIYVYGGSNNQLLGNTVQNRGEGIRIQGSAGNAIDGNTLSGNTCAIKVNGGGPGNSYTNNDMSNSSSSALYLSGSPGFVLTGNTYDDSANGLSFQQVDGMTLTNLDLSAANIPGTVIGLNAVANSTFSNINASGTSNTGIGIWVYGGGANQIIGNTVAGRDKGVHLQGTENNTVDGNTLTHNGRGIHVAGGGPGNSYTSNDLSNSSAWGLYLSGSPDFILTGNTYDNSANGLGFQQVDGMTLTNLDLSAANTPGTVISLSGVTNSTISNINASGTSSTGIGIQVYGGGHNQLIGNTVQLRAHGIQIQGSAGNSIDGNTLTDNTAGIVVYGGGPGNSYSNNDLSRSGTVGIWLDGGQPGVVTGNLIAAGSGDGLVLWHGVTATVFRNNIYGNAGYQAKTDSPAELSDAGLGNFWGHVCPGPLFTEGVDSNRADVVDSFPYGAENAWLEGGTPGCGPPDNDGDSYTADVDCNDDDPAINPGATEICDLVDNNCDGAIDDLGTTTCGLGECEHTIDNCVGGVEQTCDPFEGATDEICDLLDNDCNGVVDDAATLLVEADHHVVGGGSHPGSTKTPTEGLLVSVYDKAVGSCARDICGGVSWQQYECIVLACNAMASGLTDAAGEITFQLPTGDYLVIGDDGSDKHLGVSASDLVCGEFMRKYLQRLETANGKRHPGKTSKRTGSELLIIEPEYVEWNGVDELYPFVFESVGDWDVTTSVEPPEGFVADHDQLSEEVDNALEALQFTLTDIGSDWVPTGAQHVLEHGGRRETIVGRVGVLVAPGLAHTKGLDRWGHPLGPDGHPIHGPGFDPRAPRPVEVVGWIEASAVDPVWVFKLRVDETSEFSLEITRGQGVVERTLFDGQLTPGEYELDWDGLDDSGRPLLPGLHWLTLRSDDMVQKEVLIR